MVRASPFRRKGFHFRMRFSPLGEGSTDATLVRHIEVRGKTADIVKHEQAARRQRAVPEIEFSQGRLVFVRAVENDQFRIATQVFAGRNR